MGSSEVGILVEILGPPLTRKPSETSQPKTFSENFLWNFTYELTQAAFRVVYFQPRRKDADTSCVSQRERTDYRGKSRRSRNRTHDTRNECIRARCTPDIVVADVTTGLVSTSQTKDECCAGVILVTTCFLPASTPLTRCPISSPLQKTRRACQ